MNAMPAASKPIVHLIAGSTGAGKTTYALSLAARTGALRFSIDEWMTTLFEADRPDPIEFDWMMQRIGRCEAMIWILVEQGAEHGTASILDLGFTTAEHRARFAEKAQAAGLPVQLHFLDVPAEDRWARVQRRNAEKGETYRLTVDRGMFDFMEGLWQAPDDAEMAALNGVRAG